MTVTPQQTATGPVHLTQGDYAIGTALTASISTILGSCIATCLWDPGARVGGMNHFLLPEGVGTGAGSASFGVNAMEILINALAKQGALRGRLQAKVFGGASMIAGLTDVGARNASFVRQFLKCEGIPITAESVGGTQARRVEFWPGDGRARQRLVGLARLVPVEAPRLAFDDVELF